MELDQIAANSSFHAELSNKEVLVYSILKLIHTICETLETHVPGTYDYYK
jgi:hypothetical protein